MNGDSTKPSVLSSCHDTGTLTDGNRCFPLAPSADFARVNPNSGHRTRFPHSTGRGDHAPDLRTPAGAGGPFRGDVERPRMAGSKFMQAHVRHDQRTPTASRTAGAARSQGFLSGRGESVEARRGNCILPLVRREDGAGLRPSGRQRRSPPGKETCFDPGNRTGSYLEEEHRRP